LRPAKGGFLDEPSSVERLWEEFKLKASTKAVLQLRAKMQDAR
jgi:hypothetical protein